MGAFLTTLKGSRHAIIPKEKAKKDWFHHFNLPKLKATGV
jgi:hypothetical protein